ncbi:DUF29 family protein [Chroococcidiopsis sp. CCMEE 29]|uniref:DUF29 family protein n=1 Tax=Chroococcidiopsis sp. CCMEE 29 TaxID=155894 RepID=UPI0031F94862
MKQTQLKTLYDRDFALWVEDTVNKLKARNTEELDWENLIEKVESLGISQRRAVRRGACHLCNEQKCLKELDC